MSATQHATPCWTAKCDGCQESYGCADELGTTHFASESDALAEVKESGWTIDADGWWCEDCHDARICRELGHIVKSYDYADGPRTYCSRCGVRLNPQPEES